MPEQPQEPTTEQLRAVQIERAQDEREHLDDSATEAEERAHQRRAAKAEYLAEKLAEQTKADDEAE
jgi:hypothetical protein